MKAGMARAWKGGAAAVAALCAAAVMVACGGGGGSDSGTLRVALTDAPACGYDHVYVTVEKVRVHRSSGAGENEAGWSEMVLDPPKRVDLLELTNGVLSELGEMPLEAGRYTQMRLVLAQNTGADPLANAVVPTGGTEVALKTPSGQQSGIKMKVNIDVQPDQMADVVIDMDGCRSVVVVDAGNSSQRLLKPVVRVVPRLLSGVMGHVEAALAGGTTRVSLQQGGQVVRATVPDSTGRFLLQPVDEGIYDLVVTAAGRATTVVTGVTVVGDTVTPVNTSSSALAPLPSDMATADGAVTPAADALVRATQELASGTVIEVAGGPVAENGDYEHAVPVAGPRVAPYGTTLTFTTDTGAAGKYTMEATSGESVKTDGPKTFAAGATVTTNFTFP